MSANNEMIKLLLQKDVMQKRVAMNILWSICKWPFYAVLVAECISDTDLWQADFTKNIMIARKTVGLRIAYDFAWLVTLG